MISTPIREATVPVRQEAAVPLRFGVLWRTTLVGADALAALAAAYLAGVPPAGGVAIAALLCVALWMCGAYRSSYAVRRRDEFYHVAVAFVLAAIPLVLLLHAMLGLSWLESPAVALACAAAIGGVRTFLAAVRRPDGRPLYAGIASITADAQWRAEHSPGAATKRVLDAVAAAMALLVLAPLLLAIAVLVALDSGVPVLFRQKRVGRHGEPFTLLKFRTMRRDAGTAWAKPGDGRITRLGAFLRRSSLDELPQFVNVLRGEMSLVGPRPEMWEYARRFAAELPNYSTRHIVPPGLTGWAQVHLKRNLEPSDVPEVLAYDLFYVENASPVLDGILLFKTAAEFLLHRAV